MMKPFSAWVVFAALLCFVPTAFGQARRGVNVTSVGAHVLSNTPPASLTGDHRISLTRARNDDGWGNQGGGGNGWGGGWGWGGGGWGGGGNGGGVPVPEGGTTLMYLALAGLCCFGAMAFRVRQRACVPASNN